MLQLLCARGADVNAATNEGSTVVESAYQSSAKMRWLWRNGDASNESVLLAAANYRFEDIVKEVFDDGLNVDVQDRQGQTALMRCVTMIDVKQRKPHSFAARLRC